MLTNAEWTIVREAVTSLLGKCLHHGHAPENTERVRVLHDKLAKLEAMSINSHGWSETHTALLRQDIERQGSAYERLDELRKPDAEALEAKDYHTQALQLLRMWFAVAAMRSK